MTTFPAEIRRGADGYSMMRWESYDLSVPQWLKWLQRPGAEVFENEIAASEGRGTLIETDVVLYADGRISFRTNVWPPRGFGSIDHDDSAQAAIRRHEMLAKDIVERIETMESHEVPALMEGAL